MMTKHNTEWFKKEVLRDEKEIQTYKNALVESFRGLKKEQIFEEKKITLWMRIKRTMGF
jgi:hypothetical protein